MKSLLPQVKLASLRNRKEESGFTVAEVMIAAIVILIVLLSTAYGLTSSFRSSSTIENNAKATQLANDIIAVAKQSPYRQLYITTADRNEAQIEGADGAVLTGPGQCADPDNAAPAGTSYATSGNGDQFPDLTYCQPKRFGVTGTGTTFYIQTDIVYINTTAAYDGATTTGSTSTSYRSKRVIVTIQWQDISSGAGDFNTLKASYTKAPAATDCVPSWVNGGQVTNGTATTAVPGC